MDETIEGVLIIDSGIETVVLRDDLPVEQASRVIRELTEAAAAPPSHAATA